MVRFSGSWVRVGAKSLLVFVLVGVTRSENCGRVPLISRVVAKTGTLTPGRLRSSECTTGVSEPTPGVSIGALSGGAERRCVPGLDVSQR